MSNRRIGWAGAAAGLALSLACGTETQETGPAAPRVELEACTSDEACTALGEGAACFEGACRPADQLEPLVWEQSPGAPGFGDHVRPVVRGNLVLLAGAQDMLVSLDGGRNWALSAPLPPVMELSNIVFVGSNLFLFDFKGRQLWRSPDAGRSWSRAFAETEVNWFASQGEEAWVSTVNKQTGLATLFYAEDGEHFIEQPSLGEVEQPTEIFPGEAFVVGRTRQGQELISWDRGATWEPFQVPVRLNSILLFVWKGSVFGIVREFEGNAWKLHVYASHDRGETWDWENELITLVDGASGGLVVTDDGIFAVGLEGSLEVLREPSGSWEILAEPEPGLGVLGAGGGADGLFRLRDTGLEKWDPEASTFRPMGMQAFTEPFAHIAGDGTRLYGFSATSNVFRSEDGGRTWEKCAEPTENPDLDIAGFDSLVSLEAHDGSVWAGSFWNGLFRSDDGCRSWIPLGRYLPTYASMAGTAPRAVVSLRATDDGLYLCTGGTELVSNGGEFGDLVATSTGVIKSTDGGTSWAPAREGIAEVGANLTEVLFDPCGRIFAAGELLLLEAGGGLYRSADGAGHWDGPFAVPTDPAGFPGVVLSVIEDGARLLAVIDVRDGDRGNLFESLDGGETWTPIATEFTNGGRASSLVRVGDRLVVLENTESGDGSFEQVVCASSDGGATWEALGEGSAVPPGGLATELIFTGEELLLPRLDPGLGRLPVDLLR